MTVTDMEGLLNYVNELISFVPAEKKLSYVAKLQEFVEQTYTPNKDKIMALMTLGKLNTDEVQNLMDTKVTYSLLISKNPYKQSKKK